MGVFCVCDFFRCRRFNRNYQRWLFRIYLIKISWFMVLNRFERFADFNFKLELITKWLLRERITDEQKKKNNYIRRNARLRYNWDIDTLTKKSIIKISYTEEKEKIANKKVKDKMATCLLITRSISHGDRVDNDTEKRSENDSYTHTEPKSKKYLPQ